MQRLGGFYRNEEIAVVRAGEGAGNFVEALGLLLQRIKQHEDAGKRLAASLGYPMFLLAAALVSFVFLGSGVLPSFAEFSTGAGAPTPWLTRTYIDCAVALRAWAPTIALLTGAAFLGLRVARSKSPGFDHRVAGAVLGLPWIGGLILAAVKAEAFDLTAAILEAGSTLEEGLELARATVSNPAINNALRTTVVLVRGGTPLSIAWKRAGLDRRGDECGMLQLAETAGSYAQAFRRLGLVRAAERDRALARFRIFAEPAALGLVAASVATALMALYEPLFLSGTALTGGLP